ncbi:unnamed protein product [Calypogeia fissa]
MSQNDGWSRDDDIIVLEGCSDDEQELPDLPPVPQNVHNQRTCHSRRAQLRAARNQLQDRVMAYALDFHMQRGGCLTEE